VVPSYIPAYRYGGPIRSVHGLCKGLAKLGHDVHVFTTNVDGERDSDVPLEAPVDIEGVTVWYFPSKRLRRLYWSPPMWEALKQNVGDFDLLHLHSIFLWPTWAAARAARRTGIPYIIAPRGMLMKNLIVRKSRLVKTAWLSLVEKNNLEGAAAIHVTSETEADEIARFTFTLPRIVMVPNGVDIKTGFGTKYDVTADIRGVLEKGPFLLFLGRVNWKKGLDRLIPALQHAGDINLVIAGNDEENYQPQLERLAKNHGVIDRTFFIGPVHGDDKNILLQYASALVLPSYSENFGIVVLEAMAAGCPVVVTPEVGLSDMIRETGSGIVVQGEPGQLGNGIKNLFSRPDLMRQMGENGKRVVKERFTWETVALRMEGVYQDILGMKTH
jgi:glycosyltransferase involved in cell wall biosynthesis